MLDVAVTVHAGRRRDGDGRAGVVACNQLVAVEPAELKAATSNEYVVPADRLPTAYEVVLEPSVANEHRLAAFQFVDVVAGRAAGGGPTEIDLRGRKSLGP